MGDRRAYDRRLRYATHRCWYPRCSPNSMAVGAGPHDPTRRHDLARALERLDRYSLHQRQHGARVGLGEDGVAAVTPSSPAPTAAVPLPDGATAIPRPSLAVPSKKRSTPAGVNMTSSRAGSWPVFWKQWGVPRGMNTSERVGASRNSWSTLKRSCPSGILLPVPVAAATSQADRHRGRQQVVTPAGLAAWRANDRTPPGCPPRQR